MGCDIHMVVEVRSKGAWALVHKDKEHTGPSFSQTTWPVAPTVTWSPLVIHNGLTIVSGTTCCLLP